MKKNIFSLFLLLFITGCTKNPEINSDDIIFILQPKSYFPVYPGSYWKYLKDDQFVYIDSTAATYQIHNYYMGVHHNEDGSSYKKYSNPVKVPFLNGQPIYQYQALEYHGAPYGDYYRLNNFLSEKVGNTFSEWMDTRYGDFTEHKEVVQKTIDKNHDSILIVKGHWVYGPLLGDTSILIYTKNIGLTSSIILNENRDTISKTILIEYFINKQ